MIFRRTGLGPNAERAEEILRLAKGFDAGEIADLDQLGQREDRDLVHAWAEDYARHRHGRSAEMQAALRRVPKGLPLAARRELGAALVAVVGGDIMRRSNVRRILDDELSAFLDAARRAQA